MSTNKNDKKKKSRDIKPEFIINPVPPLPEKKISEAQQIQLDIIAKTNFNFFHGEQIAKWLRENHKMWRAVLLPLNFISLRDMDDGHWHADTLYIYPEDGWQSKLEEVMKEQFGADETRWIGGETAVDMLGTTEVADKSYVILEAWWD
ncbi:MAG TPA: hypothetical protein VFY83_07890 [Anaerolineales bacterium]|jgi:hypothetical protein|nr:hypothetical protein [Anaerolineales bacterium]